MTPEYEQEIAANLERAEQSIKAAKDLAPQSERAVQAAESFLRAIKFLLNR